MKKHRKILSGCFIASFLFHVAALLFLQRYSLWFSSSQKLDQNAGWLSQVDKKELDQILKSAFSSDRDHNEESAPSSHKPEKESISPIALRAPTPAAEEEIFSLSLFQSSFPSDELLAFNVLPTFSIPSDPINLLEHLPKELLVPTPLIQTPLPPSPIPVNPAVALAAKPPSFDQEIPSTTITYAEALDSPLTDMPKMPKAPSPLPLPQLPQLPTLAELETSSYSDSFDADLVFLPKGEEGGYIFALTLIPRPDLALPRIRQHFTFLFDKSNSIQQERLTATKSALHKILGELSPEDTFNIIAFDSKTEKMSPNDLPATPKSFAIAEAFLEKIHLGSFFSSSDIYRPLFLTVPGRVENDEIYTAILLTDGEAFGKKQVCRSILYDWTQYNAGKVALYALGLNSDSHFATLDTAALFNRGKLSSAPTSRGIKRKLIKLIKSIQTPLAKNLVCKAISRSPQSKVHLFPRSSQSPHLYLEQPYVILGETDTLGDFILFVQGRLKDKWLNIKKTISFVNAKKGSKSLKKEWALQQAYGLYEQYAYDEDPKHLVEAETILEPFDLQVAFR